MKNTIRAPKEVYTNFDQLWELKSIRYEKKIPTLTYIPSGSKNGGVLHPSLIETEFSKKNRPEPESKIISQGKYECAPASLAMLLGCSLFESKRAHAHSGWNNDNSGCSEEVSKKAARLLGFELINSKWAIGKPCLVSVKSLNVKKMNHSVCWNGSEILDPNFGDSSRFYWGPEWAPWTIGANEFMFFEEIKLSLKEIKELELYKENLKLKEAI